MGQPGEQLEGRDFPCPLCGEGLGIRLDVKHGKPYVICDSCGVQMFVRRKRGIERLEKQVAESDGPLGWLS